MDVTCADFNGLHFDDSTPLIAEPFPHMELQGLLPEHRLEALLASLKEAETVFGDSDPSLAQRPVLKPGEKRHYGYHQASIEKRLPPVWLETMASFLEARWQRQLFDGFAAAIRQAYPELVQSLGPVSDWQIGLRRRDDPRAFELLADCQFSIHEAAPLEARQERGPHVKMTNKLLVVQYFLRPQQDTAQGGDYQLFSIRRGARLRFGLGQQVWNRDNLELKKEVPYQANRGLAFLNTAQSVQCMSERASSFRTYYINLIFETAEPLFQLTGIRS
ncbi:MAG: hypothetical protein HY986_13660 [Candidatus Melainabacteria bacterium]|nr:hypothetical protein [Candidatus Melainabacteria bacterium]